ncbi:putative sulfate exporter family transporter, partial [Acinetobacter soli]
TLIGVGSSICGGSAIAATAPVIHADDDEIAQSISVIFLFNVLAALIFPWLGGQLGLSNEGFALFAGTAVNDTSSVTAAAAS